MKDYRITIKAEEDQFESARQFLDNGLKAMQVPKQIILESELVFEEFFLHIAQQYRSEGADVTISLTKKIGEVKIVTEFSGQRFDMDFQSMDPSDLGAAILNRYEDKISLNYKKRRNTVTITVKRTHDKMLLMCLLSMLVAVFTYIGLSLFLDGESLAVLRNNVVFPIEKMFTNALIMIAAPVTFFSLVTNITNSYVIADNRLRFGRLVVSILLAAVIAEAVAAGFFYLLSTCVHTGLFDDGAAYNTAQESFSRIFVDNLWNIVPQDIFQPFMSISPFPMFLIALLTSAAICSTNNHFRTIKKINDAVNDLFSKALSIVMLFMPAASFLAILDVLIYKGYRGLLAAFVFILYIVIGGLLMLVMIGVRVALAGINPITYLKKCRPAIAENFRINSSIDAVPYNTRFCNKVFGIPLERLDVEIPILAQINQTCNSFILMTVTLMMSYYIGIQIDAIGLLFLGILLVFISIGAPGQDGSLLIGLIIIFSFTGMNFGLIATAIYVEAIIGRMLPVMNALFDITTVVSGEKQIKGPDGQTASRFFMIRH